MSKKRKQQQIRRRVLAATLALTLGAAGAAAAAPAWSGGWPLGLDALGRWWAALTGDGSPAGAASEAAPNIDPDGVSAAPQEPDASSTAAEGEEPGESDALPRIDPNG